MKCILTLCSFFIVAYSFAQELYMPRDVKEAYKQGTRSPDGMPGKNYWQNYARYNIHLTTAPPQRTVYGRETITYKNNSTNDLHHLVFRLTPNIHRPGAVRYSDATADYLTAGMIIDTFALNGQRQNWEDPQAHVTWQVVALPQPLKAHDSITISFSWHYDVSLVSNREGMIDPTTFFLAYFYPRVAVYDDYNGWDTNDFTDQQEFYNDFCDYTFSVTVPKDYIVWATGNLLNPQEVLQPAAAAKLASSMASDEVIHVATKEDIAAKNITAPNATNTWQFSADYIPDVTIGLSDHYVWDAGSVVVDDASRRRASVQAAYNDTAADFHQMVVFGKHALDWFSHKWPGVAYPYPKTTIFQGYADMEYPMMVNDNTTQDLAFSRFVAEHEIAHTWFPFNMGINETRYAFMDEGWATTFELLIGREDMPPAQADELYKNFRVTNWINDASTDEDIPIIVPANLLRNSAYGNNAYGKPSLGYLALKDMLGDDLFKKCLHEYIERWHGRHPIPWDFFNSFNTSAAQNLNWFWHSWYFTNNYIDYAITNIDKNKKGYTVNVSNVGGYPAPFDVVVTYADSSTEKLHQSPALWQSGKTQAGITIPTTKKVSKVTLEGGIFMDATPADNKKEPG